jgi:hypothetical protein
MNNRKSFILYFDSLDCLDELSKEQIADLFIAIRDYNKWLDIKLDWLMKALFINFKNQFDRDLEKYNNICDRNSLNWSKWWRPKQKPKETQKTQSVFSKPRKADNDNDNDNDNDTKKDNDNIIINNNNSKELLILEKKEYWNKEINELREIIKKEVSDLWFIYKPWKYERERIKNILTSKDYWNICKNANMTRVEFCIKIIQLSNKLEFWKWKINNAETFYNFYAKVYNEWKKKKEEIETKSKSYTSVF